jgi:hypothetical protein
MARPGRALLAVVNAPEDIVVPAALPLLESLSWFDKDPRALSLFDMLQRYEGGFKDWGVVAEPSPEEREFIRKLAARYGSILDV